MFVLLKRQQIVFQVKPTHPVDTAGVEGMSIYSSIIEYSLDVADIFFYKRIYKRVLHQPNIAVSVLPWPAAGDLELTVAAGESTISRWRDWFISLAKVVRPVVNTNLWKYLQRPTYSYMASSCLEAWFGPALTEPINS